MKDTNIKNVFIIPDKKNQFIVYLPVYGILFKGNASTVNLFNEALKGNKTAQKKFGFTGGLVKKICKNDRNISINEKEKINFNPISVSLFLTSECSMKCVYCYANGGEHKKKIDEEYIKVAINEVIKNAILFKQEKIKISYHGGGDIGVVWDLVEKTTEYILKQAGKHKIEVKINAGLNGILSEYQRHWVVQNLDSATISLDGYDEIQNKLRPLKNGQPSFDIVNDTLKYFDKYNFNYSIRTTVTSDSIQQLEKIISFFCKNYKVKKIKAEPVFIQGRASQNKVTMPEARDFIRHFIKSQAIATNFKKELMFSGARFNVLSNIFCLAAGESFAVTPDGYITSCYEVLEKSNPVSDIFFYGKIQNGEIIIFQDRLEHLSTLTVENINKCQKCFAKYHCAGDCPVKNLLSEKDEMLSNYRCSINRELTKIQLLKMIS